MACCGVTFRPPMNILMQVDITNHGPFVRRRKEGGRTLAKQWNCYQNKVNPVPNKTDKRTITVKLKLLKTSFVCTNIKKHVPSFDTASTKDALYTVICQLYTSQ
jgi:hypothetical protein